MEIYTSKLTDEQISKLGEFVHKMEEECDKYRNMVFDKMEQIDKAKVLLKKWIEPKYDREELLYLTEQFLNSEVEK